MKPSKLAIRHCPRCEAETLDGRLCASCQEQISRGFCAVAASSCGRAMPGQSPEIAFPCCNRCAAQLRNTVKIGGYLVSRLADLNYAVISAISRGVGARWWLVKAGRCQCPSYSDFRPCVHAAAVHRLFGNQMAQTQTRSDQEETMPTRTGA